MNTNNIKKIREQRGLTQQQLADRMGVSRPRISEWENQIFFPNWKNMIKLSKALDSSVDELFVKGCKAKEV